MRAARPRGGCGCRIPISDLQVLGVVRGSETMHPRLSVSICSTLTCALDGSVAQVRGVAACDLGIVTGSRDKTVRLWVEEGKAYTLLNTMVGARMRVHATH